MVARALSLSEMSSYLMERIGSRHQARPHFPQLSHSSPPASVRSDFSAGAGDGRAPLQRPSNFRTSFAVLTGIVPPALFISARKHPAERWLLRVANCSRRSV